MLKPILKRITNNFKHNYCRVYDKRNRVNTASAERTSQLQIVDHASSDFTDRRIQPTIQKVSATTSVNIFITILLIFSL